MKTLRNLLPLGNQLCCKVFMDVFMNEDKSVTNTETRLMIIVLEETSTLSFSSSVVHRQLVCDGSSDRSLMMDPLNYSH